jgi:hypothetical protein
MFRIRNRYLPSWLHRLANGLFAWFVAITLGVCGITWFRDLPVLPWLAAGLLFGSPLLAILAAVFTPRFSLLEGLAGEDGYDDLNDPGAA